MTLSQNSFPFARIIGTGGYLPEKILTNEDLSKLVDTSDEWIFSRTGIKQRHVVSPGETTASMAYAASQKALEAAGIESHNIDLIIVATCSAEYDFPSIACYLQKHLKIHHGGAAFDVNAACSGFIYALRLANQAICLKEASTVLVVGTEAFSRLLNWEDRNTCVLFGDGAGAVLLRADANPGIYSTHIHAHGEHTDLLYAPHPSIFPEEGFIHMQGNSIFKLAVQTLKESVISTLKHNHFSEEDLDWLVPHQANIRIIQAIAERLQLPMEKVITTVDQHANTSAASIPLALDSAIRENRIKPDDLLLLEAFGGGLTWGSALIRY